MPLSNEAARDAVYGTSRLLLRLESGLPGTGCFELSTPDGSPPGEMASPEAATSPLGDTNYVFGEYRAPDTWGTSNAETRPVEVTVRYKVDDLYGRTNVTELRTELDVQPTPALLVHGIWSSEDAWSEAFADPEDGVNRPEIPGGSDP